MSHVPARIESSLLSSFYAKVNLEMGLELVNIGYVSHTLTTVLTPGSVWPATCVQFLTKDV